MMLSLLPLLVGISLAQPASAQDNWITFGEIKAFGQTDPDGRHRAERSVTIKFPSEFGQPVDATLPGFEYDGGRVLLNKWGNLGRVHWGSGGWAELKELYTKALERIASGQAHPWKVKAIIFTRSDLLHRDEHGVLVPEDSFLTDEEITLVLESFARFEAFIEAASGGAVDIQTSFSLEDEPYAETYESDLDFAMPSRLAEEYYSARLNRGDFDSVITVLTAAEASVPKMGVTEGRVSGATQSRILFANGAEQGTRIAHTEELVRQFLAQVRLTAGEWGYGKEYDLLLPGVADAAAAGYPIDAMGYSGSFGWLRDYARYAASSGMWAKIGNRVEPDYAAAYAQTKMFSGTLVRWGDIASDPWAGLPIVTGADIATRIGATGFVIQDHGSDLLFVPSQGEYRTPIKRTEDPSDVMLNNQLSLSREGIARIGYADRDLLLIRWDIADFVINHLGDHAAGTPPPANVMGVLKVGDVRLVVVDTKLSNDTLAEANLIDSGDVRSGIAVLGKGVFNTGEPIAMRFSAEAPDARFAITNSDGNGVVNANGVLQIPNATPGVHFLKAVAALPSGERVERPFVIRVVDPISIDNLRYQWGQLRGTLTNHGPARSASIDLQLPSGWTSNWNQPTRNFGAYETATIGISLTPSANAGEGPFGATMAVSVSGSPSATGRASIAYPLSDNLVENRFEVGVEGWDVYRWDGGGWSVSSEDGGAGIALAIRDGGGARWGKVTAYGRYLEDGRPDPTFAGYSLSDYPYLNFSFKSDAKSPLAITFTVNGIRRIAMLTGSTNSREALPRVSFIPDGTWQMVSYNLLAAMDNQPGLFVTDIAIGDPRTFEANDYRTEGVQTHWIDDFRISKTAGEASGRTDADAELNPVGDMASTDPYLRALGAARAQGDAQEVVALRGLLKDINSVARLNAAAAFARIKDPGSVAALVEAAKLERIPYPAVMFVRALAFQDTPEAWDAMQVIVRQGRGEEMSVSEAARLMGATKDPKYIEGISILLTSRSWPARRDGVLGLASIPTDSAALMMMTFLMEIDPMVRLAVAQNARVDVDPVGKRMEWGSVNDRSSMVRAYNFVALTKSADPLLRSRGYAGIKEDDIDIRRIIAASLRLNPMESHVTPLLSLLSDPSPEVRAAAVESLFAMPGERTFSEISVLAGETQDEVLYPLLEAARVKKVELPRSMLERLLTHRNPLIRDTVKGLIG